MATPDVETLDRYIRTRKEPFTFDILYRSVSPSLQEMDADACMAYLASNRYVFFAGDGTFVTYAGAFSDRYFSILPTRAEVEQGLFCAGSRCSPFADSDMDPHSLRFRYDGKILPSKAGRFASSDAVDMFTMFDVQLAPQYIADDPANADAPIADNDFVLPSKVSLTGVEAPVPLVPGDRLLCRVSNWDEGIIDIETIEHTGALEISDADIARREWYDNLEAALLDSFDKNGPSGGIDEQLALVFINNADALCIPECGSVSEYMETSSKVGFESYGIETRLWRSGEVVPVVGDWNKGDDGMGRSVISGFIMAEDYAVGALLTNQLHKGVEDPQAVLDAIVPPGVPLSAEDKAILSAQLGNMYNELKKDYNSFSDEPLAALRERVLALYLSARSTACAMYAGNVPLGDYSQKALVLYLQAYNSVQRILYTIQADPESALKSIDESNESLDNIEEEFSSANDELLDTVAEGEEDNSDDFVVTSGTGQTK